MKAQHAFIFQGGIWLGEGKINISIFEDVLAFNCRWNILNKNSKGGIDCLQEIQVKGISDVMFNQLLFHSISNGKFIVDLDNPTIGKVVGEGLITDTSIAWEFKSNETGFEGFEFYEKQPDQSYSMQAEYVTGDQMRTAIKGRIWQKMPRE